MRKKRRKKRPSETREWLKTVFSGVVTALIVKLVELLVDLMF